MSDKDPEAVAPESVTIEVTQTTIEVHVPTVPDRPPETLRVDPASSVKADERPIETRSETQEKK